MQTKYRHANAALNYLPRRPLLEDSKGHVIYSGAHDCWYLVAYGRVKVVNAAPNGAEAVIRVVPPEGLFGESCLVGHSGNDRAVALDKVQLMAWKRSEI